MPEQPQERAGAKAAARLELAAILLGGVAGLALLYALYGGHETDFENLGLGKETTPYFARHDDHKVHCIGRYEDAQECIADLRARNGNAPRNVVLWLGNSQLHGINQMKEGEETAAAIAHKRLEPSDIDLFAVSRGNTNPEEHLVWFTYLRTQVPLRALVLPVVFVSLRRSGVHASIAPALENEESAALLRKSKVGRTILEERLQWGDAGNVDALAGTLQERSESLLVGWLEDHSRLWDLRFEARGNFFRFLRTFRNTLLQIEPGTKRPMIRGSYDRNMAALEAILEQAREAGVRVLVYVAPLRQDVEPPYIRSEYAAFKSELSALAMRGGAMYADFDDLVPTPYWGTTNPTRLGETAEIDFLHFQYPGHLLLADRVVEILEQGGIAR